jgi:hypothetical protein
MPNTRRLTGRFFCVLISLAFAFLTQRFSAADNQGLTLCQINDTVYQANGSPAQGTVVILWPAFTTAAGQPIAAGSTTVQLGTQGQFSAALAPNSGATPAGSYYRATYKLSDGTTESEVWSVPATQTTTIGAIRSKLVPASQAAQMLTRDFADSHYISLASDQTVSGVKSFASSPSVPAPQNPNDAANKAYVDANAGGGNLSSPPPIGNVTPNSGNFTTLTVQTSNGIPNPAHFPQTDPCAQINAAIGALPSQGGTIDARGFAPNQTCNASINANKPVTILFGAGYWVFNGNPGINVSAPNVVIQCPSSAILQGSATTLTSGAAAPLIANLADPLMNNGNYHTADGTAILNCALDGENIGTFGIFAPAVYSMKVNGVHVSHFTGADILMLAAQNDIYNTVADGSGGDGIVWGADSHVSGMSQANGNAGDGWHVASGGNVFDGPTAYANGCYGMHFDGNQGGDWVASQTYVEPKIIQPTSNNPGGYAYYTQAVGKTASTRPAQFCQSIGCVMRDGGVTWINVGDANVYLKAIPEFFATFENINSPNISESNTANHPGDWDDIFIEGTPAMPAYNNSLLGAKPHESAIPSNPAHGVHLKYARNNSIRDTQWYGGAYNPPSSPQPDLGGLDLDSSSVIEVDDLNCTQSYNPCLIVTNSSQILVNKLVSFNGGAAGSPAPYLAQIDSASNMVSLDGVDAIDLRYTPYQRGIVSSGSHVVVKNEHYQNLVSGDMGVSNSESYSASDSVAYNAPGSAAYQWNIGGTAVGGVNSNGFEWFSPASSSNTVSIAAPMTAFSPYQMTWPTTAGSTGQCLTSSGGGTVPMTWSTCSGFAPSSPPPLGNITPNSMNATSLTYQSIPGVSFLVSHYATIQDAINAAYSNGNVLGEVIDDRTSPYNGPGFVLYDSVTLKLAPTTYSINSTATYNNGNNNVSAGIIALPGARLLGAGTSTNHGTVVQPANGLNADLIATSTVGTGTANPQWWHWGEIANLRLVGNGANQTSGDCLKIENMGEVASVHDVELSACYNHNFESIGYAATQSTIANITTNRAVHGSGVAFTNLSGVAMLNGISGDCNQASLIAANFNAAGTLTIHGLKAEAESSICNPQVQDPVILASTTDASVLASIKVDGGYAFGTAQHDMVKSAGPGTVQYQQENFYLNGYTNVLNDTVRGQTIANSAATTKQPVFYLSNGVVFGNQAFTFQPNTFMQANPSGTPTEVLGVTSSGATLLADSGNGDNSSIVAGGIQIAGHNRAMFGQSPEVMARWGYRFLGASAGYDTTKWDLVPAWHSGDITEKNLGNPLSVCQKDGAVSCRWSNVYAQNVDTNGFRLNGAALAAVASSGSYSDLSNKPTIPIQGSHIVAGSLQGNTAPLTGNSSDQTIYSANVPAGTFAAGQGLRCSARWTHSTSSTAVTYKWTLGGTTVAYGSLTSSSQNFTSDIEIFTISSLTSEIINLSPIIGGTSILAGPSNNNSAAENLANASTVKLTFNLPNTDWVKGSTFYCQTIQ